MWIPLYQGFQPGGREMNNFIDTVNRFSLSYPDTGTNGLVKLTCTYRVAMLCIIDQNVLEKIHLLSSSSFFEISRVKNLTSC